MQNSLESVVIVTNQFGSVASIRFSNSKDDRDISWTNKHTLYEIVEKYIAGVLHV